MKCTKCGKGTCILVTESNKKMQGDKKGIIHILTWPFRMIGLLFRIIFGKKEKFNPKQVWRCNYCGATFKDKTADEETNTQN